MALWICVDCTAAYSVGAAACPQCGSTDWYEDGTPPPAAEKTVEEETNG